MGEETTDPVPLPIFVTVRIGRRLNVAIQVSEAAGIVTVIGDAVPVQPFVPVHPKKNEPDTGAAVNTTAVEVAYRSLQSFIARLQMIPDRSEITVPVPVPSFTTVRSGSSEKIALQEVEVIGIVMVIGVTVPVQPSATTPDHPEKMEPTPEAAVNVTGVFGAYGSAQSLGVRLQVIPTG